LLKCTKFDFGEPAGGAFSAPPDYPAGFKGAYFLGEGKENERRVGRGEQ